MRAAEIPLPWRSSGPALSWVLTGLSIALLALSLAAGSTDPRLLDGVPVWAKPAKFAGSFVLLFGTIAWLETRLSEDWRKGWLLQATIRIMAVCMIAEMAYILHQAGLGEPSHFNLSTAYHSFMYTVVMAFGAVVLVIGIGIYGYAAWADREARLGPALRLGTALGFGLSFALTFFVAGYIGGQGSALVGIPGPDHATWPVLGWSGEVGDLRPAHFLALHAMQALPLFGAALDRWSVTARGKLIIGAAVLYSCATLAVFVQARMGEPLIPL